MKAEEWIYSTVRDGYFFQVVRTPEGKLDVRKRASSNGIADSVWKKVRIAVRRKILQEAAVAKFEGSEHLIEFDLNGKAGPFTMTRPSEALNHMVLSFNINWPKLNGK